MLFRSDLVGAEEADDGVGPGAAVDEDADLVVLVDARALDEHWPEARLFPGYRAELPPFLDAGWLEPVRSALAA